jgi:GntR family transcriptional repressor for pyruvate dehydrogenase complex
MIDQGPSAKLSDVAYAKIAGSIANAEYPVGTKLPTENEMAEMLSVSRPIIREALARLRDDGLVVSRRGSGTYVRRAPSPADHSLAPLSSISDMRRCLEFRIAFEGEAAFEAARGLTAGGWERLAAALAQLEQSLGVREIPVEEDYAFHLAVASASENRFFAATLASMREPITVGMGITRNLSFLRTEESVRALHREHAAIATAVEARDPEAARDAMRLHLNNAMRRAFEGTFA